MISLRVSQLDTYRAWTEEEDSDLGWLLNELTSREDNERMRKGRAFHKCLEKASGGRVERLECDGYTFEFTCDCEIALPEVREVRLEHDYGGIIVTGKVDAIRGRRVWDHKTTASLDAERYMAGYQWRLYLDIAGADRFTWHVFEMDEVDAQVYQVYGLHILEQFRYPRLHEDCQRLALDCKAFCDVHLPGYDVRPSLEMEEAHEQIGQ